MYRFAAVLFLFFALFSSNQAQTSVPFRVYLTFEDGPTEVYTPQILDILAQHNAKATFLIAGYQIAGYEALIQREVREGHAIVNHLWVEPGVYAGADADTVVKSYLKTEAAIREALGAELPRYDAQPKMYWQPGGTIKPLPTIEGVSVITYNPNVDSDDCGYWLRDVDLDTLDFDRAVIDNVLNTPQSVGGARWNAYDFGDGVIIAMHDINRVTVRVLPTILNELAAAGATFEALPRPWDQPDTMPVRVGVPPVEGAGVEGVTLTAETLDHVNLRQTPELHAPVLDVVPVGASLTAIGRAPGWIQVRYGEQTGWIARNLLKVRGPIPTLPAHAQ